MLELLLLGKHLVPPPLSLSLSLSLSNTKLKLVNGRILAFLRRTTKYGEYPSIPARPPLPSPPPPPPPPTHTHREYRQALTSHFSYDHTLLSPTQCRPATAPLPYSIMMTGLLKRWRQPAISSSKYSPISSSLPGYRYQP